MSSIARITVTLLLALAGAHASAEAQTKPKADRNVITAEEIRARPVSSVQDLIRSRRPSWLSVRGLATLRTRESFDPYTGKPVEVGVQAVIAVYVDNVRVGTHDLLRSMSTDDIESIERLEAGDATYRFGTGHEYGAIVLRRRTR